MRCTAPINAASTRHDLRRRVSRSSRVRPVPRPSQFCLCAQVAGISEDMGPQVIKEGLEAQVAPFTEGESTPAAVGVAAAGAAIVLRCSWDSLLPAAACRRLGHSFPPPPPAGGVKSVRLPMRRDGDDSATAFVNFHTDADAVAAMQHFQAHPLVFGGVRVTVEYANIAQREAHIQQHSAPPTTPAAAPLLPSSHVAGHSPEQQSPLSGGGLPFQHIMDVVGASAAMPVANCRPLPSRE